MSIRFPIFAKMMLIVTLLISAVGLFLTFHTSDHFENTSLSREKDYHLKQVDILSWEIDHMIQSAVEKIQLYALTQVQGSGDPRVAKLVNEHWMNDYDIVSIRIHNPQDESFEALEKTRPSFLEQNDLPDEYFQNLEEQSDLPFFDVLDGQIKMRNASSKPDLALVWLGVPLAKDENNKVTQMASAFMRLEKFQQQFAKDSNHSFVLIDENAQIIAHPDQKRILNQDRLDGDFVDEMLDAKARIKQSVVTYNEEETLLSRSKTRFGGMVVSLASLEKILAPIRYMKQDAYYVLGLILSLFVVLSSLFSLNMTRPIEKLHGFTKRIAKGEYDLPIRKSIKNHDEVGDLAQAMQDMGLGLKEREKMKNLFDKFHGSSITDELMNKEIELSGTKKDVVVFFSDIRSFTKFSENRPPEEVVSMLNEYLDIMVKIIYKHKGIVDKFVGDAIMAVWGVPESTGDECQAAVSACLEMRVELEKLNQRRIERGEDPIMIGIGLHEGEVISGTIGSVDRMEYTIIGDTVNTAARIEASTKSFGTDLLLGPSLARKVVTQFICEKAGGVSAKGKTEALELYRVEGLYTDDKEKRYIKTPYSHFEAESDGEKTKRVA